MKRILRSNPNIVWEKYFIDWYCVSYKGEEELVFVEDKTNNIQTYKRNLSEKFDTIWKKAGTGDNLNSRKTVTVSRSVNYLKIGRKVI